MLFILRHGERGDHAGHEERAKVQLSYDPHLTELGKIQARKAGDKIVHFIDQIKDIQHKKEDLKYLIISSPFRRCIQTAFHASQSLPKEKIIGQTIFLNDFIAEHLELWYLHSGVLSDLQIRTKPEEVKDHVGLTIQDGFPTVGDHASTPKYPESQEDMSKRVCKGYAKIKSHYLKEVNKDGNVVLILVSHANVVGSFLEIYGDLKPIDWVEYTAVSQFLFDPESGKEKLIVNQHIEHLKEAEKEYASLKKDELN